LETLEQRLLGEGIEGYVLGPLREFKAFLVEFLFPRVVPTFLQTFDSSAVVKVLEGGGPCPFYVVFTTILSSLSDFFRDSFAE
jgi:hypothetical protein